MQIEAMMLRKYVIKHIFLFAESEISMHICAVKLKECFLVWVFLAIEDLKRDFVEKSLFNFFCIVLMRRCDGKFFVNL